MTACDTCGTDGSFLFPCPDCGGRFCEAHRSVEDHACVSSAADSEVEDGAHDGEKSGESTDEPAADPTGSSDEALDDETVGAPVPEDESSDASENMTNDPNPSATDEAARDEDRESTERSNATGGIRHVPLLGRFFD